MDFLHKFHRNCESHVGYPGNHDLFVCRGKLTPGRKLKERHKIFSNHYPRNLKSFLDLSSCRGYFVLNASQQSTCERSLGIDVNTQEIELCRQFKQKFNLPNSRFELLTLEDLAKNIDNFGGAFQTVLLANTYQYLYFGSDIGPAYLSHERIFEYLSKVCGERLIFTNRVEKSDCQNTKYVEAAGTCAELYTRQELLDAASKYFTLTFESQIGKYPLFVLDKR